MRLKKLLVFLLVFWAVIGLNVVDGAYSDMMDRDGQIGLEIRRVNSDYITLSIFGKTKAVNTKKLGDGWQDVSNEVTDKLDVAVNDIRELLGAKDEEPDYSVFHVQIL
jgi:hypothetical protein